MGQTRDLVTWYQALEQRPYDFSFYQTLRELECLFAAQPRIGEAQRPVDEPIRLGQTPSLAFAPASLSAFVPADEQTRPRLEVAFFGMLGPNGPLPLHLTEYARERLLHGGDETLARFLDIFHHRFLSLFYRAWAQAQPTANLDRPDADKFADYVGALMGLTGQQQRQRDEVGDHAKLHYAGLLSRQVRNADALAALLADYFQVKVTIEQFVGHWVELSANDQSRLGQASAILGRSAVAGSRIWDRQSKIRIHLGPLNFAQYQQFLPGSPQLTQLRVWLRQYLSFELEWDVRLVLKVEQAPPLQLGQQGRLGWTSWLGNLASATEPKAELVLDAERYQIV